MILEELYSSSTGHRRPSKAAVDEETPKCNRLGRPRVRRYIHRLITTNMRVEKRKCLTDMRIDKKRPQDDLEIRRVQENKKP